MASLVRVLCAPSGTRRACLPVFRALALVACLRVRSRSFGRPASHTYGDTACVSVLVAPEARLCSCRVLAALVCTSVLYRW